MGIKDKALKKLEELIKPQVERLLLSSYDVYMRFRGEEYALDFDAWCNLVKDGLGD